MVVSLYRFSGQETEIFPEKVQTIQGLRYRASIKFLCGRGSYFVGNADKALGSWGVQIQRVHTAHTNMTFWAREDIKMFLCVQSCCTLCDIVICLFKLVMLMCTVHRHMHQRAADISVATSIRTKALPMQEIKWALSHPRT